MSEGEANDLSARIAEETASLPPDKQSAVLDFVLSIKESAVSTSASTEEDGDAAWERIIADPRPRPKLDAFLKAARKQGSEPMDFDRL